MEAGKLNPKSFLNKFDQLADQSKCDQNIRNMAVSRTQR
jgi:hypothetical protein